MCINYGWILELQKIKATDNLSLFLIYDIRLCYTPQSLPNCFYKSIKPWWWFVWCLKPLPFHNMWYCCLENFQVRDEVEHLLDHNENMAKLHLSRKQIKSPQDKAVIVTLDDDVGDLEMLLESYFMQLDGIRSSIMMVCSLILQIWQFLSSWR